MDEERLREIEARLQGIEERAGPNKASLVARMFELFERMLAHEVQLVGSFGESRLKAIVEVVEDEIRDGERRFAPLVFHTTPRGFYIAEFVDSYGKQCSLQDSSNVDPHIWLGVGDERMHLTREMVAALIPHLARFVVNGWLRQEEEEVQS